MPSCVSPDKNCDLCPRLEKFRKKNRAAFPDKFNAPVPSFGDHDPLLVVVGLAPGLKGANFSGRPFTGDSAGDLLYPTLVKFGFAAGRFDRRVGDGLKLKDTRITNAVRCVPPENKPLPAEINACRDFLESEFASFRRLRAILALGAVAHDSVLKSLGLARSAFKFGHGNVHALAPKKTLRFPVTLIDSYHCSGYNVKTRRLTLGMFEAVVAKARETLGAGAPSIL
ncbi:MAG TPA: uracil-DNA glycosylase [Candidatus Dormibacteraeota bacterium]|nr:uracil-DNA glycosylase [Candidatus Dormibacteraeota bacterium]